MKDELDFIGSIFKKGMTDKGSCFKNKLSVN